MVLDFRDSWTNAEGAVRLGSWYGTTVRFYFYWVRMESSQ